MNQEEQLHKLISGQLVRISKLEKALNTIKDWRLPMIASEDGKEHSYTYMYGSNGARDYMRRIAEKALED